MWDFEEKVDKKVVKELSEFISSYIVEQVKKAITFNPNSCVPENTKSGTR